MLYFRILFVSLIIPIVSFAATEDIQLPNGFAINEYATGLKNPRFMAYSPDGVLFVTDIGSGKVVALVDTNNDGRAEGVITFASGLKRPNSIAFHEGYLYVGETDRIVRYKYDGYDKSPGEKEIIVPDLPASGHVTRTISFGPDGKMYVSIGSSCNVCVEEDKRRAAVLKFNPDGRGQEIFAAGLRNSVGLRWHPETRELWATDNGRDWLGDNLPPDEVNILQSGKDYGWPYCYGDKIPDPEYNDPKKCKNTVAPALEFQAHSAPLGLEFYQGKMFPDTYVGDLFIAYHGSWNRSVPTGYKIVRVKMNGGTTSGMEDFATGWLRGNKAWGRPVDVLNGKDGELFVSDDKRGVIYRITYTK